MLTLSSTLLETPNGKLEVCIEHPAADLENPQAVALICHPHPLHGGTMKNKVISTLAKTFRELNCISVRFNYRGVGKSDGHYDNGIGETDDALFLLNWIQQNFTPKKTYLAGFSFGAFVSLRAATLTPLKLTHLWMVAPAILHADYQLLAPPACPWTVIIPENDTIAEPYATYDWIALQHPKPNILSFDQASHFFDGRLIELRDRIKQQLS